MNKEFVVNSENAKNSQLFMDAVRRGYVEIVGQFLKNGADVNRVTTSTWTKYTPLLDKDAYVNNKMDRNYTPLHLAVAKGFAEVVTLLLRNGAEVNAIAVDNVTPLHIAAETDNKGIAELLLNQGANMHYLTLTQGFTPLHFASERGNLEAIKLLLNRGADINFVSTKDYLTPLHVATKNNQEKVVSLFLQRGAEFEKEDKDGKTILYYAVDERNLMILKDILNYFPKVDNRSYRSLLKSAVMKSGKDMEKIVETLIEYGFKVKRADAKNRLLLKTAVKKGYLQVVEQLLKYRAPFNYSNFGKFTLLHIAVQNGNKEMIKLLIDNGAYVDAKGARDYTPLHLAVERANEGGVALLLRCGADVNAEKKGGITPLHTAAEKGYTPIIKLLLSYRASIHSFTLREGYMPIHFSSDRGNLKAVELYLKNGADINVPTTKDNLTALHIATKKRNVQVVSWLLQHGAQVDKQDIFGKTSLNYAVENGDSKIVKEVLKYSPDINNISNRNLLLNTFELVGDKETNYINITKEIVDVLASRGANVDAKTRNGDPILHVAVEKEYKELVEALLENNANVNLRDNSNNTPLHISAGVRNVQITKMLLNKGANVDGKDEVGGTVLHNAYQYKFNERGLKMKTYLTPLHMGAIRGDRAIVETLLEFDANVNCKEKLGRTPLHFASLAGYLDVVKLLLQYGADLNQTCVANGTPLDYARAHGRDGEDYNDLISYYDFFDDFVDDHYYLDCKGRQYKLTFKFLKLHAIKMKKANLYLNERNLYLIRNCYKYGDFQNKCEEEIARMKSEKIENTNITFYDILTGDRSSLAKCMSNENLVQALKADGFKTLFPTYADLINLQFRKAMQRKELITASINSCHILFPELVHECTEKIVSYLNDDDLRTVIKACKS